MWPILECETEVERGMLMLIFKPITCVCVNLCELQTSQGYTERSNLTPQHPKWLKKVVENNYLQSTYKMINIVQNSFQV